MPAEQKEIYYMTGPSRARGGAEPAPRGVQEAGLRRAASWSIPSTSGSCKSLTDFDKRKLKSVTHGDIDLGEEPDDEGRGGCGRRAVARGEGGARRSRERGARLEAAHRQRELPRGRRGRSRREYGAASSR